VKYLPAKEWGEFMVEADTQLGAVMKEAGIAK
jgi:hypothetical protein